MTNDPERAPIVIVGGGLAGLTCATILWRSGIPIQLFEKAASVGGRLSTTRLAEGFQIDQGFQVIFDAYPALRRHIDVTTIPHRSFTSGLSVWTGRRRVPLVHPLREPSGTLRTLTAPVATFTDRLRLATYALQVLRSPWESAAQADSAWSAGGRTIAQELVQIGLSSKFQRIVARPFWGGITLDPNLSTAAGIFRFTFQMLLKGRAILPDEGAQALPRALANSLPSEMLHVNSPVDHLHVENGHITGVVVSGSIVHARTVVVATDALTAHALTGLDDIPTTGLGCITIFLATDQLVPSGPQLVVDGTGTRRVNHWALLSRVQPTYSTPGVHLVAGVLLGQEIWSWDDDTVVAVATRDASIMLGHPENHWRPLAVVRTPFAQFAQPSGCFARQITPLTPIGGLYRCGEYLVDSSINGAIISGERAAHAIITDLAASSQPGEEVK